jgi:hypothetical protein
MKNKRELPIPFLILILAGLVSVFSLLATRTSRAGTARGSSLQMQMVEQERMAALYFRILSWLSDVNPNSREPVKTSPQPTHAPPVEKSLHRNEKRSSFELCTFKPVQNLADNQSGAGNIN